MTALASLALGKPVDSHIAMTGELSLSGEVLPIGGLKEKLFGAMRAGIRKVLIPADNERDWLRWTKKSKTLWKSSRFPAWKKSSLIPLASTCRHQNCRRSLP